MDNKLLAMILTVTVSIICIATVMVPIINDVSTEKTTSTNAYTLRMSELGEDTLTLSYDSTDKALINGEHPAFTNSEGSSVSEWYVITENAVIVTYGNEWFYLFIDSNGTYHRFASGDALALASITFEEGTATLSIYGTTYTFAYTWVYYPALDGDYAYSHPTNGVYLNADDSIISFNGGTSSNGVSKGTIDGLTTIYHATDGDLDTESFTATITVANAEKGLSTIKQIVSADPNKLIVPLDYEYMVKSDGEQYALYQAIIVITLIAVLLAAVRTAVGARYD